MNKNKVKKSLEYKSIDSILKTSTFIGFFCLQNMSVKDKSSFKKSLGDFDLKFKIIKPNLLTKPILKLVPNLNFLASGSFAICYFSKNKHNTDSVFTNMQNFFKLLKKDKNTIFLGNLFNNSLNNSLFEKKIASLNSLLTTQVESLALIQNNTNTLLAQLSNSKNKLSLILAKKK